MATFSIRKAGAVLAVDSTTVAYLSMIPATNRSIRIVEVSNSGLGTATALNEFQLGQAPVGTTPGGAVTPNPFNPASTAAAGFTTATSYATAPVTPATAGIAYGVNSNGGTYRWLAKTNFEIISQNAVASYATCNWRVVATGASGNVCGHIIIEEL